MTKAKESALLVAGGLATGAANGFFGGGGKSEAKRS